jgi:hypothetical protein
MVSACGGGEESAIDAALPADAGPCSEVVSDPVDVAGKHINPDAGMLTWPTNPPSSGNHYGQWYKWARVYTTPVPRENYVHNLEHGGVVFSYNCPSGCADEVAKLESLARSLPKDPACTDPIPARWLVTPDPLLPEGVVVAAAAWGSTYTAKCVDARTLKNFWDQHFARKPFSAPENFCSEGQLPKE